MAKKKDSKKPGEDDLEGIEGEGEDAQELDENGHIPVRIKDHARAVQSIARIRAWAALGGFVVAALICKQAGMTFVDLVVRSIAVGAVTSLIVWAGAIAVWRQILFAEIAVARRNAVAAQQAMVEAFELEQQQLQEQENAPRPD